MTCIEETDKASPDWSLEVEWPIPRAYHIELRYFPASCTLFAWQAARILPETAKLGSDCQYMLSLLLTFELYGTFSRDVGLLAGLLVSVKLTFEREERQISS